MCQENYSRARAARNKKGDFDCFGELYKTKAGYLNINLEGNNKYFSNGLEISKEISLGTDKIISGEPKPKCEKNISSGRCTI